MRAIIASICALMTIGTASAAELTDEKAAIVARVREVMKAWSDNDAKSVAAHLSPSIVITGSVPPYLFQGPTALADWIKSFAADAAATGITDPWQTVGEPTAVEVSAPRAYVSLPVSYAFKRQGKPAQESATVTATLMSEPIALCISMDRSGESMWMRLSV